MAMSEAVVPLEPAARAGEAMTARAGVGDEILRETIEAAAEGGEPMESGRTWCESDPDARLRRPTSRHRAAVNLDGCPPGDLIAVWHSHTSPGQVRNPEHSLPDVANVVFGHVDASMIPGAESDHLLVAGADRGGMADRFRNVLGADVQTTRGVVDAIQSGEISNPARARDRVNSEFAPLMRRVDADRPRIATLVDELFDGDDDAIEEPLCEGCDEVQQDPSVPGGDVVAEPAAPVRGSAVMRRESRIAAEGLAETLSEYDITGTVVGTTVGMFTSRLLERAVFGE